MAFCYHNPSQQQLFNTSGSSAIGTWTAGSGSLGAANAGAVSILTKDYAWIIGGYGGSHTANIYRSPVDSNGYLGSWTLHGESLPAARTNAQLVQVGNKLYLIGGEDSSNSYNTVYTCTIGTDGLLGAWSSAGTLPLKRAQHFATVTKNRIYLFGGYVNGSLSNSIIYAPINSDGTLGSWTNATYNLQMTMTPKGFRTSTRVYIIYSTLCRYATIQADGSLSDWTTDTTTPYDRTDCVIALNEDYVWLLGGGGALDAVYRAPLTNGVVGTWASESALAVGRNLPGLVITSSRIYVLGGYNASTVAQTTWHYASFSGGVNDYLSKSEEPDPVYPMPWTAAA
jgi:hypothetical protein